MKKKSGLARGIYKELIEIRTKQGVSQRQLGRLIGRSSSVICRFESGKYDPHLGTLEGIANALGYTIQIRIKKA